MLLQEMFSIYGLYKYKQQITIVSDGGSENKGDVLNWIGNFDDDFVIKKTAKTQGFIFTNNEIESTFNIFKNEFIGDKHIVDRQDAKLLLANFQGYNDNERYPISLYGCAPQEVFDGFIIDKYRFRNQIKQTAQLRHLNNKVGRFCDVCSEK